MATTIAAKISPTAPAASQFIYQPPRCLTAHITFVYVASAIFISAKAQVYAVNLSLRNNLFDRAQSLS